MEQRRLPARGQTWPWAPPPITDLYHGDIQRVIAENLERIEAMVAQRIPRDQLQPTPRGAAGVEAYRFEAQGGDEFRVLTEVGGTQREWRVRGCPTDGQVMGSGGTISFSAQDHRQLDVLPALLVDGDVAHRVTGEAADSKLTAKKWAALAKCSVPTAQRDILELVRLGILLKESGGSKNTRYSLASL